MDFDLAKYRMSLSPMDKAIILYLDQHEKIQREEFETQVGRKYSTMHSHIMKLIKYGILERWTIPEDRIGQPGFRYKVLPISQWGITQ